MSFSGLIAGGDIQVKKLQRRRRRRLAVLQNVSNIKVNLRGSRMRPCLRIYVKSI
jgi:hypothetical protein